jgi:hypothetical protein
LPAKGARKCAPAGDILDEFCEVRITARLKKPAIGFPARVFNSCDVEIMQVICPTCQFPENRRPRTAFPASAVSQPQIAMLNQQLADSDDREQDGSAPGHDRTKLRRARRRDDVDQDDTADKTEQARCCRKLKDVH